MNVPFGGALTGVAALPPGSTFGAADAYAEKPAVWPKLLITLFFIWWIYAFVDDTGILFKVTDGKWGKDPATQVEKDKKAEADKKKKEEEEKKKAEEEAKKKAAQIASSNAVPAAVTAPAK
jgi:hypothetical protein